MKPHIKKNAAILLTLIIILSLFSGLRINAEAQETCTYMQVSTITSGQTYLIVAVSNSKYYAMNTSISTTGYGYLEADEVTNNLSSNSITLEADDVNGVAHCFNVDSINTSSSGETVAASTEYMLNNTIMTSDESIVWTVQKPGSNWHISLLMAVSLLQHNTRTHSPVGIPKSLA